jgi:ABC-2 type transport system ATP-binding protein
MQTETREPVLRVVNLVKRFGNVTALTGLNLQVLPGEVYGLLGPNGAGKSTLIGSILGLVKPNGGAIEVFGQDARHNRSEVLRRTGAVIESPAFYPYMGGSDNLQVVARTIGGVAQGRIDEMLELVGLGARGKDKVKTYSTGMRQRLGLASVLLGNPDLVILDEPTSGLDPAGALEFRRLIRSVATEQGKTVFISSHLLTEVEQMCDRVGIIKLGQTVAEGRLEDLLQEDSAVIFQVDNTEVALKLMKDKGLKVGMENGDGLIWAGIAPGEIGMWNTALVRAGIEVSKIVERKSSLEAFFLDITADEEETPNA